MSDNHHKTAATPPPSGDAERCSLGVGCDEAGVCYASAHGQPEQCPHPDGSMEPEQAARFWLDGKFGVPEDRDFACDEMIDAFLAGMEYRRAATPPPSGDVEKAVMVCPQCEGEGSYADGLDESACSTECTRCGSNGWIVDLAALSPVPATPVQGEGE